jgi:hypothetical protein
LGYLYDGFHFLAEGNASDWAENGNKSGKSHRQKFSRSALMRAFGDEVTD